jgi:hypothetical protein
MAGRSIFSRIHAARGLSARQIFQKSMTSRTLLSLSL